MSKEARDDQRSDDALILWVLQFSLAVIASFFAFAMKPMGVGGCAPDCDYTLLRTSIWGFIGFAMTIVAATGILLLVLRFRRRERPRRIWWIPLAGIALTLVALLVFNGVGDLALRAAAAG